MTGVPVYALYGEEVEESLHDFMHCESIAARSSLHAWEIQPHRHEAYFQILYIRGGFGEAVVEGRVQAMRPPVVLTVPSPAIHGFVFSSDVDGLVFTIHDRTVAQSLAEAPVLLPFVDRPVRIDLARAGTVEARRIARIFETVAEEFRGSAAGRMAAIRAGLTLLFVGLARAAPLPPSTDASVQSRKLDYLHRFRQLVDRDFRRRKQVEDYAGSLAITATHLNRICRELLGRSALGVINRRVVLEAERDLIYTSLPVGEISLSLGFADPAYFSRFFSKHAKCGPREFRRRHGQKSVRGRAHRGVEMYDV